MLARKRKALADAGGRLCPQTPSPPARFLEEVSANFFIKSAPNGKFRLLVSQ